jgi:hypothetical protein
MTDIDYSCKLPWIWLVINLEQDRWRFCCKTNWQPNFFDSYSVENSIVKVVQKKFLKGRKPDECRTCWREEELSGVSYRTGVIGETKRELLPTYKGLEFIDLIYGSLCNLRCGTCGPWSSTQWSSQMQQQEQIPYNWLTPIKNNTIDSKILEKVVSVVHDNIETLNHLNLYGGEPSIDPNFIQLIDGLCDLDISSRKKNPIALRIYTNGVWPDNDKISEKFLYNLRRAHLKGWKIDLKFSIDAAGKHAEYIRHPTKWDLLDKHLDMTVEAGYTNQIHISSSLLNIPVQHEILYYFAEKKYRDKVLPVNNLVSRPEIFSIANLGHKIVPLLKPWEKVPDLPRWREYKDWLLSIAQKQSQGQPDMSRLKVFNEYTKWYANVNKTTVPADLEEYYNSYLE